MISDLHARLLPDRLARRPGDAAAAAARNQTVTPSRTPSQRAESDSESEAPRPLTGRPGRTVPGPPAGLDSAELALGLGGWPRDFGDIWNPDHMDKNLQIGT